MNRPDHLARQKQKRRVAALARLQKAAERAVENSQQQKSLGTSIEDTIVKVIRYNLHHPEKEAKL